MGKAWPPGTAEHVTTARGDRTDGHFGFAPFRRHGSSVVHTPCWRNVSKPLLACSLALERVAPGGMGRAWPPGAAEHVMTARGKTRTYRTCVIILLQRMGVNGLCLCISFVWV